MATCTNCGGPVSNSGPKPRDGQRYCMATPCQSAAKHPRRTARRQDPSFRAAENARKAARRRALTDTALASASRGDLPPIGQLVTDDTGETIQCHACGRYMGSLPRHIYAAHGLTAAAYRARYGLYSPLVAPATQARLSAASIARNASAALTAYQFAPGDNGGNPALGVPMSLQQRRTISAQRRGRRESATS